MRFDQIDSILSAESTEINRIRALTAVDNNPVNGIVDGTDDCDKAYWERDGGPIDAIKAIYDMLNGRNTQGSIDLLGTVQVDTLSGLTTSKNVSANDGVFSGKVTATGIGQFGASVSSAEFKGDFLTLNQDATAGIRSVEHDYTPGLGDINRVLYENNSDMIFKRPYSQANYAAHGQGGGWRFVNGATARAFINAQGTVVSGGASYAGYSVKPGFIIYNGEDDSVRNFMHHFSSSNPLNTAITRFGNHVDKSPLSDTYMQITSDSSGSSDVVEFYLNSAVQLSISNSLISSSLPIYTSGSFSAASVSSTNVVSLNTIAAVSSPAPTADNYVYGSLGVNKLFATTQVRAVDGAMSCSLNTTSAVSHLSLFNSTGDHLGLAHASAASDVPVLYSTGSSREIRVVGGLRETPSNEITLRFPEFGPLKKSSISLESSKFMFCSDGVIKVANKSTDLGGSTIGYHKHPNDSTGGDLSAGVTAINLLCNAVGQAYFGSTVVIKDSSTGRPITYVCDGTNWRQVNEHGFVKHVNAATFTVGYDTSLVLVDYSITGLCTVTLDESNYVNGDVVRIKDSGGFAGTNNITILTSGSALIDGYASMTMSTNGESKSLYFDGTDFYSA